ncbi:alpha/beta fold hydrolase [Rhodobacteraceae bacterium 63075]|nr:alpha/beta fold hydrolase [Rhodobacteraceae bacterium 63075]
MKRFGKWLGGLLIGLLGLGSLAYFIGPYEPVETDVSFDPRRFGEGVGVYFESVESAYDDITEGVQKRVIWAGERETRTPVSVLFVHGFSATSEEIRPVPDRVAEALGANLVFTRLTGHGRPGAALAEASVRDWMEDLAEGLAAARAVGEEVIVMSVSTGGTLAALSALDAEMSAQVKGYVFISPNFGINDPMAPLLTMPGARHVLPLVAGAERSWEPVSERQEKYWTTRYPTVAVFPMAALVKHAVDRDYSDVTVPALFHFSDKDLVVKPEVTRALAARWGGPVTLAPLSEKHDVSASHHVIAGDITAPEHTGRAVTLILSWIEELG